MHPNEQVIRNFFQSFAGGDYAEMQKCLHPDVEFTDIGFDLRGKQVAAMWHMLCIKRVRLMFREVNANGLTGGVRWQCDYEFQKDESSTPRPVHNEIASEFWFSDGKIKKQRDVCDFDKWADQALGIFSPLLKVVGTLTGNKQLLHEKVQKAAKKKIDAFMTAHSEYADA